MKTRHLIASFLLLLLSFHCCCCCCDNKTILALKYFLSFPLSGTYFETFLFKKKKKKKRTKTKKNHFFPDNLLCASWYLFPLQTACNIVNHWHHYHHLSASLKITEKSFCLFSIFMMPK